MTTRPPVFPEEQQRLTELRNLLVLDSAPEAVFDSIARLASEVCGAPIALLSLVDEQRQWFKANVGLPGVNETPRDVAFCAHALGSDDVFEVPDATDDARFAANPLVTGSPDIRFYAGAPLVLPAGERIGTLCVIDRQTRQLTPAQSAMLEALAGIASQALIMRRDLIEKSLSVRSQYEQALAASEASHRALVEVQSELVSLADPAGELIYVNPAYARHFDRTPLAMVGSNLFDLVEPGDRQAVRELVAEVMRSGARVSSENRMIAPDGSERRIAWTNSVLREADGRALLHSVGRDVTERHRIEQALRASQAFLYRTGRAAGVGGWEVDLRSSAITWSDETRRIHEVGPDYVPDLATAIEFYAPEARADVTAAVHNGMSLGQPWDLELPFVTGRGRRIWVRTVGEVEFEDGSPARLVGAFQDITQRKDLELRLADNERFLRRITDGLPVRISYMDAQRRYRFVNLAHCKRFGREREDILGRRRDELTQAVDPESDARVAAALAGQAQRFERDELLDGQTRRIEIELTPDVGADGEVRGLYAMGIDITQRSAAEKAMRLLNAIFDNTTDAIVQSDWRGRILYMNPAARRTLGIGSEAPVTSRSFDEFNTPATNRLTAEVIVPAVKAQGVWVGEAIVYDGEDREVPVSQMVIAHRDARGRIDHYSAVMRDISAQVEAQRQLQQQSATLRSVIEAIPAIVAVVGVDLRYRFVNNAFARWLGGQRSSIIGCTLQEVLGRTEYARSKPWVERVLNGETVSFQKEYPGSQSIRHLGITYIPLWLHSGAIDGYVTVALDITQQKHEEGRLVQLAQRDALTGLLNRVGFDHYVEQRRRAGGGGSLALLYIDLDHFKPVNDRHGHPVGDQVLQLFAQRLTAQVRPTDAVARLGGDEFAVALPGIRQIEDAHAVADKIVRAAQLPFQVEQHHLTLSASVGVAFDAAGAMAWKDLVAQADARLYQAKEGGRGRRA